MTPKLIRVVIVGDHPVMFAGALAFIERSEINRQPAPNGFTCLVARKDP